MPKLIKYYNIDLNEVNINDFDDNIFFAYILSHAINIKFSSDYATVMLSHRDIENLNNALSMLSGRYSICESIKNMCDSNSKSIQIELALSDASKLSDWLSDYFEQDILFNNYTIKNLKESHRVLLIDLVHAFGFDSIMKEISEQEFYKNCVIYKDGIVGVSNNSNEIGYFIANTTYKKYFDIRDNYNINYFPIELNITDFYTYRSILSDLNDLIKSGYFVVPT